MAYDWTQDADCVNSYLMDESSGNLADSSGSTNLTASGTPTYSQTGKFGTSIYFNSSNPDYFSSSYDVLGNIFTMVGWIKPDNVTTEHMVLWVGDKDTTNNMQFIDVAGSIAGDPVRAASFSSDGFVASTKTGASTDWNHVAGVWASASSRIVYLNGVPGTEETSTRYPQDEDTISIGATRDSTPAEYTNGDIDEVALFSSALDSTDINDIMDNGLKQDAVTTYRRRCLMGVGI